MASKGVQPRGTRVVRPHPIVVPPIDLTVGEDMDDDTKEWDTLPVERVSTHTQSLSEGHMSQSSVEQELAIARLHLSKKQLHELLLLLWRPAVHLHTRDSLLDSITTAENNSGCQMPVIRTCVVSRTSHLFSSPPSFEPRPSLIRQEALPTLDKLSISTSKTLK